MLISKRSALSIAIWAQNLWEGSIHDPMTPEHNPNNMWHENRLGFTKRGNWGGPVLSFGPGGPLGFLGI